MKIPTAGLSPAKTDQMVKRIIRALVQAGFTPVNIPGAAWGADLFKFKVNDCLSIFVWPPLEKRNGWHIKACQEEKVSTMSGTASVSEKFCDMARLMGLIFGHAHNDGYSIGCVRVRASVSEKLAEVRKVIGELP